MIARANGQEEIVNADKTLDSLSEELLALSAGELSALRASGVIA